MPKGLLITGTDTGVGKTFVGCGLAAALRRRGLTVAPFKPAESGCARDATSNELIPADALALQQATQTSAPLDLVCPYRFEEPLAPSLAAKREGKAIDPDHLANCYSKLSSTHDVVLVETAGGILVPLTESLNYTDLASRLELPVVLVAGSKLGVINHTLLSLELLWVRRLQVIACVLNHPHEDASLAVSTNEEALLALVHKPLLTLPRVEPSVPGRESQITDLRCRSVFDQLAGLSLAAMRPQRRPISRRRPASAVAKGGGETPDHERKPIVEGSEGKPNGQRKPNGRP